MAMGGLTERIEASPDVGLALPQLAPGRPGAVRGRLQRRPVPGLGRGPLRDRAHHDRRRRGVGPVSSSGRYRHLFTPLRLGPVTVANRIVFSAHLTNYAADGLPTEQHAAYYAARAAGGSGLIITEEHSTHPTDWPYEKLIHGFHPEVIDGYRRITDAVHAHGVPIFAQLNHNGGQASSMYSRLPVWAPSPVPDPLFREVPKAVEHHEIAEIVDGYATVAGHCIAGGFDGIELQCSHSSIVRGFLSPATNRRTDDYGGSLADRARLLLEIVDAVRATIGSDRALGVRICGDELIEGGTGIDDAVEVARMVEATGQVDYINTSIGVATATLYMIEASMQVPPGLRAVHPERHPGRRRPAGGRGRPVQGPAPGRPGPGRRRVRPGRAWCAGQIADPDFARQGPVRPRHRHPHLPVLQPGVRGPDGPQPVARLHREPARRTRVGDRAPARAGGARSWWWAADPGGCRPRSPPPSGATRWSCSSATTAWAARPTWPPACPAGPSSSTSPATSSWPPAAKGSTCAPGSRPPPTRSGPSRPGP